MEAAAPGLLPDRGRVHGVSRRPLGGPLAVGAAALAATGLVAAYSPYRPGSYGLCPVLALTGWYCPACGGLRAVHDLTQLDLVAAWAMNPVVVLGVPVLIALWVVWFAGAARGGRLRLPGWMAWAALGFLVAFGIARNTPMLAPLLGPA